MVLVITMKDETRICEEIRTAKIDLDKLVYFRSTFYAGEQHELNVEDIDFAYIIAYGKETYLVQN